MLKSLGLKYRIDEDAVWVATPEEMKKTRLETKIYSLNKGIHAVSKLDEVSGSSVSALGEGQSMPEVKNIKDLIEFPAILSYRLIFCKPRRNSV